MNLSRLIPGDMHCLEDLVDALYFLIYEGAGSNKLRFLKANGGTLEESECEFVWNLKYLRNKWLRHDVDHGSEIKKSWKELGESLNWFGLDSLPNTSDEVAYLHSNIIIKAKIFLESLIKSMQAK